MNLNNFQRQNDSKSSHIHSQEWGLGHTEDSQRLSSVDPSPLQGLRDCESRGGYGTQSCCHIISSMLFLQRFLSCKLIFPFARRGEEQELRILISYFQGKQGCTKIQWAWLRLICLGASWSHIHSIVPHMPRQEKSIWFSSRDSHKTWSKLQLCS